MLLRKKKGRENRRICFLPPSFYLRDSAENRLAPSVLKNELLQSYIRS